jgi:hypothetical protein
MQIDGAILQSHTEDVRFNLGNRHGTEVIGSKEGGQTIPTPVAIDHDVTGSLGEFNVELNTQRGRSRWV